MLTGINVESQSWLNVQQNLDGTPCYFIRLAVEGHGVQLLGPIATREEAERLHADAMDVFGHVLADMQNGDYERWLPMYRRSE